MSLKRIFPWTAPEVIRQLLFSKAGDVWRFVEIIIKYYILMKYE